MKTINTTKTIFLAVGEANRQLGNGFRAVVVPEGTVDSDDFRRAAGFRPNCLESGRFYWKGDVTVKSVTITLSHHVAHGAEMHNAYAVQGYDYIVASVVDFGSASHAIEKNAIAGWVMDNQAELNAGLALLDFEEVDLVVNLTQHAATTEQVDAGVVEPENKIAVQAALTFDTIPSADEMRQRAELLAAIAKDSGCKKAMIGGAPFFMAPLERALLAAGIAPVYAFSVRDSREESDGNGGVRKVNVFKHVGFVEASQ